MNNNKILKFIIIFFGIIGFIFLLVFRKCQTNIWFLYGEILLIISSGILGILCSNKYKECIKLPKLLLIVLFLLIAFILSFFIAKTHTENLPILKIMCVSLFSLIYSVFISLFNLDDKK